MIPLDTGEPPRIPGDFRRNSQGNPLVKHPTKNRDVVYDRPSKWFDDYTGIDPIYANRGSFVHKLTELVDDGVAWRADLEFVAQGVALGIPADTQQNIARAWLRFLADHDLTVIHNEHNVVNDDLKVAGTLDRVVHWQGRPVTLDIKSGSSVTKTAYAVQLARYAGSIPYDVDTDERGAWGNDVDQTVGLVAHLKLNDILKGAAGVKFELVAVDLTYGQQLAETLRSMKDADTSWCFTTIAPPLSSLGVEAPTGDDDTHGNAASSPVTLAEFFNTREVTGVALGAADHADIVDTIRTHRDAGELTLDEWRATFETWEPLKREAFAEYRLEHGITKTATDAERLAAYTDFDATYGFHNITTTPAEPAKRPPKPTALPAPVNEGDNLSDGDVAAAGKRYGQLGDDVRPWVTDTGAHIRLSPGHGGRPTVRRFALLRGLCTLAETGYHNDDIVKAIAHHILGDIAWQGATAAAIVAALDVDEAARFARMCDTLAAAGDVSLRYELDGRAVLEPSVLHAA